ncbi:hypothetical protein F5J12DRAFT_827827 [Pisolithus orientalis]|uniref:uncharacterized protein n=1 Tax=Pisolithus orientalis TaxID=936130 RepID=UPI0022247F40|nr:uncharacterized protein F5J12DRAFT_827827 [Pisolithus orientalis]KAI6008289.1 hypothetical protein F5J12DRAFT_827827 [Pisolithus orientalis]
MDSNISPVKKVEDGPSDPSKLPQKPDVKPIAKTLNRVPRACNACRKQKMRCEGADNPPCRRCRHAGLECLFEKPSREATLTGEAGLERIRSLEAHVADIKTSQASIQNSLHEIMAHLRGPGSYTNRSPSTYQQPQYAHSPTTQSMGTPPMPSGSNGSHPPDHSIAGAATSTTYQSSHHTLPPMHNLTSRHSRASISQSSLVSSSQQQVVGDYHSPQLPPVHSAHGSNQQYTYVVPSSGAVLPPFSSIGGVGTGATHGHMPARYPADTAQRFHASRNYRAPTPSGSRRALPSSSNVTSADSSDVDDEDNGELPASGLVAPWEVLRGLADVAVERATKENGEASSEPQSRARTPSPERQTRPSKRRKIRHKAARSPVFPDVVTQNLVSEEEARELFRIFYAGCSTFLPVFDSHVDSFDALHERSPFAVDAICMVAARVRDGGGKASETYTRCLEAVQNISRATLFAPVTRVEAVQAMILVSGWSDNGWLSGGHAVRMAMELSLHKAWPRLLRRMQNRSSNYDPNDDRELVIASRTWFCLYLFEHQLSYGTGRPAILTEDESICQGRLLLQHPLAIEDDMRLVSTVELMAIRERVHNKLSPFDRPVDEVTFAVIDQADTDFRNWYNTWDEAFSQKYEDAAFYRQSLQIQQLHAQLFHNATALRGINSPDDVQKMPKAQRELAIRSIKVARQGLDITVNSPSYSEGMKYAVHYTHATATFAASFLLRLARLFPNDCDTQEIRMQVERLVDMMSHIPGKRYAITLQLMLKRAKKRKAPSTSRSPNISREVPRTIPMAVEQHSGMHDTFSPTYDPSFSSPEAVHRTQMGMVPQSGADADTIWRGFEMTSNEQLPFWITDHSLGGNTFSQQGMDAFLLPPDYRAPQIW